MAPSRCVIVRLILTILVSVAAYVLVPCVLRKFPGPEQGLHEDPYRFHLARFVLGMVPAPVAILVVGVIAGAGGPGRASWSTVFMLSAAVTTWGFLLWLATFFRPRYQLVNDGGSPQVTFVRWRRLLLAGLPTAVFATVAGAQWARGQWGRQESILIIAVSVVIGGLVYRNLHYRIVITAHGLRETSGFARERTVEWRSVAGLNEVEQMGLRRFQLVVNGGKVLLLQTRWDGFPAFAAALLDHLHECGSVSPGTRQSLELYARLVPRSTGPTRTSPNES